MKNFIPQEIKNIYHLFRAILANIVYGFPSKKIKVIGVTGTNGKTTTIQMITKILEESGKKVAMTSTINFKLNGKEEINKTKFTTLSPFEVQKFIKKAADDNHDYLVLETSSHSLDQHRVWGVDYDIAVITNVTREHLDYHKTMQNYRDSKKKLFEKAEKVIVNLDMENPQYFLDVSAKEKWGYCIKMQNEKFEMQNLKQEMKDEEIKIIKAENVELSIGKAKYQIQNTNYQLNLPGKFNIENALAATCVGLALNIEEETISNALRKIEGVPGRMERIPNDKGLNIIVDYAVTPDSLEKLYELIQESKEDDSKIISIFGSCGERDRGKRPIMGEIVSRFADFIIVTNEDPYNEDPNRIIEEVASGIKNKKEGKDFWKIFDRRKAIKKALELANPNDVIAITGKGAEETMAMGKKRVPWNDKKVILEELENM